MARRLFYQRRPQWKGFKDNSVLTPKLPAIQQDSSPLFTILPAEIRNDIYALSLESDDRSDEGSQAYLRHAFYYRPGYKKPRCIPTALLQTCQQIHAEASLLPAKVNEHTFWFHRAPPHLKYATSPQPYFGQMSQEQQAQVRHLHFFFQQFVLEQSDWHDILAGLRLNACDPETDARGNVLGTIAPRKITITLRHTDWWLWEDDEPLGIDPFRPGRTLAADMGKPHQPCDETAWGNHFMQIPSLEELVIEFETVMRKKTQLDAIIERALGWKFPMEVLENQYLVADPVSRRAYTWVGATESDLQHKGFDEFDHTLMRSEAPEQLVDDTITESSGPTMKPFDANAEKAVELANDLEQYYVVYLTWKKKVD